MSVIQLQAIADRLFGSYDNVPAVRLEAAFVARGDEMDIAGDDVFRTDPNAMLRLFYVYHSHPELTRLSRACCAHSGTPPRRSTTPSGTI